MSSARFTTLVDLEDLASRVIDPISRDMITEAIACQRVGANRSAITSAWLAVYFDLAAKIRSLALSGDEEAQQWVRKVDESIRQYEPENPDSTMPFLKIEREILNKAHSAFNLVTTMELVDLKRLRSDRNRCAHPTMMSESQAFHPSSEQARSHIHAALTHVMGKPAIRGKFAVERALRLLRDPGFPVDVMEARSVVLDLGVDGLDSGDIRSMTESLVGDLFEEECVGDQRSQRFAAIDALMEARNAETTAAVKASIDAILSEGSLSAWNRAAILISISDLISNAITPLTKGRARSLIMNVDSTGSAGAALIINCLQSEMLRDIAKSRLPDVPQRHFLKLMKRIPSDIRLDDAVRRLQHSEAVDTTYQMAIQVLIPEVESLTRTNILLIMNGFEANRFVQESWAAKPLLEAMIDRECIQTLGDPERFLKFLEGLDCFANDVKEALKSRAEHQIQVTEYLREMSDVPF